MVTVKHADWIVIRTDYETTGISQRKLAEKYSVSFNTLKDRANREGWAQAKKKTRNKIAIKTLQKTVVKIVNKEADFNLRHIELWEKILKKAERVVDDELSSHVDMFGKVHKLNVVLEGKLETISKIVDKAQKGHRLALGMDKAGTEDKDSQETGDSFIDALRCRATEVWKDGA